MTNPPSADPTLHRGLSLADPSIDWRPAGDGGWMLLFSRTIDPTINQQVRGWAETIAQARQAGQLPGVGEAVPAFSSLSLYFDPLVTDHEQVRGALQALPPLPPAATAAGRRVRLPCCYDPAFGWDLEAAAAELGLSVASLIERHSSTWFFAYALGFMPGFAYLGGLDPALALPRLTSPRAKVPASSVAIAGTMAGVYPFDSPGGWRILGRTPLTLFDAARTPAVIIQPGDQVRFEPISAEQFERLRVTPPTPDSLLSPPVPEWTERR